MEMAYKLNNGTFKGDIVAVQTFQPFSHTNDIEGQEAFYPETAKASYPSTTK